MSEAEGIIKNNLQNFMDLADYSDKFEAKVDKVNEIREAQM